MTMPRGSDVRTIPARSGSGAAHRRCGLRAILVLCVLLLFPQGGGAVPAIADFASDPALDNVRLSPNGEYIAARVRFATGPGIAIIRLADSKLTAALSFSGDQNVDEVWWVGPNRIVFAPARLESGSEVPKPTGELIGMDADGSNQNYLFGYQGFASVGTHLQKVGKTRAWARIIDPLPTDPDHALIAVDDMDSSRDTQFTKAYRLNVRNGLLTDEVAAPVPGFTSFLADHNGMIRYAISGDSGMGVRAYLRDPASKDWRPLNAGALQAASLIPLAFSRDNARVFLNSNEGGDRACLVEQTLATGTRRKLSCDPVMDLSDVIYSFDGKEPIAAVFGAGRPRADVLDANDPDGKLFLKLQRSFPDSVVQPVSSTTDGSQVVINVYSDRDPGSFYVIDTKAVKATPIGSRMPSIHPEQMGERRPVSFPARDGQTIAGFITIPPGQELKSLPLVVHPHGGPLDNADTWAWDAESQLLASRGYAVLQINYRGSAGYGSAFAEAGRQHWDGVIIDDITDGVRWAIGKGFADPKRICIFGSSFGAYAALESAIREPDLYRCAAGIAGIYDLELLKHDADTTNSSAGRAEFASMIGNTSDQLRRASPINHLDRLKAAVFIAHGGQDHRAPLSQAQALMKALDERHIPYDSLIKPDEGHGFQSAKNREAFFTRLIAFIEKNLPAPATEGGASQARELDAQPSGNR